MSGTYEDDFTTGSISRSSSTSRSSTSRSSSSRTSTSRTSTSKTSTSKASSVAKKEMPKKPSRSFSSTGRSSSTPTAASSLRPNPSDNLTSKSSSKVLAADTRATGAERSSVIFSLPESSTDLDRKNTSSAPSVKPEQSHRISQRADSVEQHSGTLPPLSKNWIQGRSGSAKSTPQVSPSRSMQSNRSRGSHNSPAVIRSGLMDRLDDLKDEIKEIENRIAKRQRELEKWKSLTVNTSARRRQFVEKLLEENNALERKLEKYDGQVINVAFLIARTDEQLRRAEARLKEVKKIKQLLEARDKKAAHTIEVAHRFMPSAMELETREVNETIYTCAALEKKVAEVHKSIQRTGESLELMNRNINRLQRDVERRNISSMPVKAYENLRETHELQQREIQRLRASISIYINAVESERARLASHQNANNRGSMDQSPDKIAVLQKKREALQDEVEDVMLAIEQRIQKINANKEYMEYLRKSRFNADEKGTPSATEARSNSRTPVQSNSRPASTTVISSTADPTPEANEPIQNPVETPPNDSSQTDTELLPHKSPILVSSSASSKEMDSRAPPSEFSETAAPKEEIDPVKDETKPAEKSPSTSSASLPWL